MYIAYLDDSKEQGKYIYSAIVMKLDNWQEVFDHVKKIRQDLKNNYGIYLKKELHASEFVGGRGQISTNPLRKDLRCKIYKEILEEIAKIPNIKLFNSIWDDEYKAFSAIMNRINRTYNSKFLIVCDEGNQAKIRKLVRKMKVHNPIPSNQGSWDDTNQETRNIPILCIEDPIFRNSKFSYFIQLADFCAYSILRKEIKNENKNSFGLHEAFLKLEPIFEKKACQYDNYGIIRHKSSAGTK